MSSLLQPGDDLSRLVRTRRLVAQLAGAVGSGLLLSFAFAPLELEMAAWFALVPLLLAPTSRQLGRRLVIGYVFGYVHSVTSLLWLNEVGFGAGYLLAIYCALQPLAWYLLVLLVADWRDARRRARLANPAALTEPPAATFAGEAWCWTLGGPLLLAAAWVALEWLQSWLFTGFPWNQLGVSQWRHPRLLAVVEVTGVYGLSFVIVATNVAVADLMADWRRRRGWTAGGAGADAAGERHLELQGQGQERGSGRRAWRPGGMLSAGGLLFGVLLYGWRQPPLPPPDRVLRVTGIQGNIGQCRDWRPEQLDEAIDVYEQLTRAAAVGDSDLIVWPETAIPAPLLGERQCVEMLGRLFAEIDRPLLAGSITYRPLRSDSGEADYQVLNSALLFAADGRLVDTYDKIHRVPFGEYVPFGDYLPWLVDWIGMGRDLTPGREFTLFTLPGAVQAGVNICFEDVFPYVSRQFVRRGADLLLTITNDAWYAESSGSHQHLVHAVFRAVENRRPLFRAGNNSDTCLIWPDGRVEGLLADPQTGNRFVRGYRTYEVPIWRNAALTFYTRHGDLFAHGCTLATLLLGGALLAGRYRRQRRQLEAINTPMVGPATK